MMHILNITMAFSEIQTKISTYLEKSDYQLARIIHDNSSSSGLRRIVTVFLILFAFT